MIKYTHEELIARAKAVATIAHRNQKRDDGQDYITHPAAVVTLLEEELLARSAYSTYRAILLITAWLHDVFEDCDGYVLEKEALNDLFFGGLPEDILDSVFMALQAITKKKGEAYVDAIKRVMTNFHASKVKMKDITHNLSNHPKNTRRDKYELAYLALELNLKNYKDGV